MDAQLEVTVVQSHVTNGICQISVKVRFGFIYFILFFFEISIDYPEEVTNCTKTWGLQNSRTKCWFDVVSSIARVIRGWYSMWLRVWVIGGRMGDTGKADMPSGRLAFATRRVDLIAAGMRAPSTLCADGMTIPPPPHKAWEKLDQMVVRVQGAPVAFKFANAKPGLYIELRSSI